MDSRSRIPTANAVEKKRRRGNDRVAHAFTTDASSLICNSSTVMPNRLARETSPYLQQHADNPVDWYAWGEEALALARELNKPILLSVGYSACHWCHVMAHESFEDDQTAALMNELYVCIKVDREERPEIDQVYMTALHALGQSGGWPLSMFLLPDGRPFFGGTYFPPEPRNGMPSPEAKSASDTTMYPPFFKNGFQVQITTPAVWSETT